MDNHLNTLRSIFTTRVRSTREGTVFTGVSVYISEGYPIQLTGEGSPIQPTGGLPHLADGDYPHLADRGGVPHHYWMGYSHHWDWMEVPPLLGLDGVPLCQDWMGYPPLLSAERVLVPRRVVCLLRSHRNTLLLWMILKEGNILTGSLRVCLYLQ